jgi:hypothetical protein
VWSCGHTGPRLRPDGRHVDRRSIAELFLDAARADPLSELAKDTAILASIALHYGASVETLRLPSAAAKGPLSVVLTLIVADLGGGPTPVPTIRWSRGDLNGETDASREPT